MALFQDYIKPATRISLYACMAVAAADGCTCWEAGYAFCDCLLPEWIAGQGMSCRWLSLLALGCIVKRKLTNIKKCLPKPYAAWLCAWSWQQPTCTSGLALPSRGVSALLCAWP